MSWTNTCAALAHHHRVDAVRRWRLVSAPSIPGLLSLDPNSDPTNVLSSLTMGTEVEVGPAD
jgi:hypothetical protein